MRNSLQALKHSIVDLLFPKVCQRCGISFQTGLSNVLCGDCFDSIPAYEDPLCDHCGLPLPSRAFEGAVALRCLDCGDGEYYLDGTRALGSYGGALRIAHHCFKFEGMSELAAQIGEKMKTAVQGFSPSLPQVLLPVPLSSERQRERGYNPSELLARELSGILGIPCVSFLAKVRPTAPQMSLPRDIRLKNPKGAYVWVGKDSAPERVLLVDDVFTTGSTLEECAKVLKKAGVIWVGAVVFGRTPRWSRQVS